MKKKVKIIITLILILILVISAIITYKINTNKTEKNKLEESYTIETNEQLTNSQINKEQFSFVGTVIEETKTYMIVEPNEDEEERKIADKITINYDTDNIDYLYGIGRKVVINYTGYIMETYPAQINTNNISVEGYSDFEIIVKESENKENIKILNNKDLYLDGGDYNLFYYNLDEVNVKVNNKTLPLEDALRSGKITLNGIISKANEDLGKNKISGDIYKDGGSKIYKYDTYTIIKCHTLDGNRDIYIGSSSLTMKDITY